MSQMNLKKLVPFLLVSVALPACLVGQSVSVDEASFRIYVNGQAAGNESFSIRQIGPAGQHRIILRGTVELDLPDGMIRLAPAMDVHGEDLTVSDYQIKVSGTESTDIIVSVSGNRFLTRIVSSTGEQLREFRAGSGSVLLDDDVVHHHHLLTPYLDDGPTVSLTVLSPRTARQQRMTLSLVGQEEIRVGGTLVPGARRFHLEGGEHPRDIWFDEQGRILRLEIPSKGLIAERESFS